jgi:hypothetical protein
MKRILITSAVLAAMTVATVPAATAHGPGYGMGSGMMGWGHGMMGPGMMGQGYGMGPGMMGHGMMGPGYGMGPGMMGWGQGRTGDLSTDDVKTMLERWITWQGNKRLQVGDIKEESDDVIVAEIVTKDGSLVDRLRVDRHSGYMQRVE